MKREKERIQKKMEPVWDPYEKAHHCLELLKKDVKDCRVVDAMAHTGCVFGNAEAAFYEKQASEDEMVSLKEIAADFRGEFKRNCECTKK